MTTKKEPTDAELWEQLDRQDAAAARGDPVEATPAPEPESKPASEVKPAPEAQPATATAQPEGKPSNDDDPFANLDPRVSDFIVGQRSQNEALNRRLKSLEGNLGGMKTQLEAARAAQASAKDAPSTKQIADAIKGGEGKWAKLAQQYPEFAEAFEERMSLVQPQGAAATQQPTFTKEEVAAMIAQATARTKDEMQIEIAHPGWYDFTQTPGFVGWVQRQKPEVQKLYSSDKPSDVIRLLDIHAEEAGRTVRRNQRLGAAAAAAGPGSAKGGKVKSEAEMTDAELWNALDQQERNQQ